jgi:hypothetical protein
MAYYVNTVHDTIYLLDLPLVAWHSGHRIVSGTKELGWNPSQAYKQHATHIVKCNFLNILMPLN